MGVKVTGHPFSVISGCFCNQDLPLETPWYCMFGNMFDKQLVRPVWSLLRHGCSQDSVVSPRQEAMLPGSVGIIV